MALQQRWVDDPAPRAAVDEDLTVVGYLVEQRGNVLRTANLSATLRVTEVDPCDGRRLLVRGTGLVTQASLPVDVTSDLVGSVVLAEVDSVAHGVTVDLSGTDAWGDANLRARLQHERTDDGTEGVDLAGSYSYALDHTWCRVPHACFLVARLAGGSLRRTDARR